MNDFLGAGHLSHSSMEERDQRLWKLYMQVIHGAGIGDVEAWIQLDVSMTQMKVLMLLNVHGQMTVGTLAEYMNTSLSNMTGIIDRLEGLEFVERFHATNDRRSVLISLTDKASSLFKSLTQSGHKKLQCAMKHITDKEREVVEEGLQILTRALQQTSEEEEQKAD